MKYLGIALCLPLIGAIGWLWYSALLEFEKKDRIMLCLLLGVLLSSSAGVFILQGVYNG